ncbi:hypothetical protein B6N60_00497 [Richelia sinica FACHB-800]|uniref:Uncharacterized protein n=1 Tax=Richelia sinica FACHB-800 TaxID=1357546 RepID=A0A975T4B7_9NOST|nr:hypothetical protein [Richelia sinica]QXE21819.1 hypothetical protein B6N60_00497 [Richelia sinica FACHB-800]
MNENFGKPARTGVCLQHAARTGVWLDLLFLPPSHPLFTSPDLYS